MTILQSNFGVLESASRQIIEASEAALGIADKLDVSIAAAKASATLTKDGVAREITQLKTRLTRTAEQLNIEGKKLAAIEAAYRETERKVLAGAEGK